MMKYVRVKRIVAMLITVPMTMSLIGCGPGATPTSKLDPVPTVNQETSAPTESTSTPTTEETTELQQQTSEEPSVVLNEAQKNSIAMLNYLAVLSQEINDSKNSRMFLEEAYASLINNTNPGKVNELTEDQLFVGHH